MICFVDDQGYLGPAEEGDAEEANRRNALLEQKGLEELGFWQVVWEGDVP